MGIELDRSPARKGLRRGLAVLASAGLFLAAAPAPLTCAQETDDSAAETAGTPAAGFGEEVVVTARRREENLQRVPISITALNGADLEMRSVGDLSELSELVPNLDVSTGGGFGDQASEAAVFIRGVGQKDTAIFTDPGVGIYVDGVYLARMNGAVLDLLDVERLEVLRGPQGTLFGKNTNGGAIRLTTRRPGRVFGGRLSATAGDLDRTDARLVLDLPLGGQASASLALLTTNRDGFSRSLQTGQAFYDDHRDAGRLSLEWRPRGDLSLHFTADATREREAGANQILLSLGPSPLLDFYNRALSDQGFTPLTEAFVTGDFALSHSGVPSFMDGDYRGSHLTLAWNRSDLVVTSITGYRAFDTDSATDGDGSPVRAQERASVREHHQLSQELHLSGLGLGDRLRWQVGGLYFRERPREVSRVLILGDLFEALEAAPGPVYPPPGTPPFLCNPGPPPPGVPCFGGAGNPLNLAFFTGDGDVMSWDLRTESAALFAQATWSAGERLSVTAGGRWTRDEKRFDYRNVNGLEVVDSDLENRGHWSDGSWRLDLAWQACRGPARPELMAYASIARGFKSGGFNGRPQQRQVLDPYDPETVLSYELGLKGEWLDRRLRANGAVFWSDYDDIHFSAILDVAGRPVLVTQNAGRAEIRGFELELEARPTRLLTLVLGVGHAGSEVVEIDPRVPVDLGTDTVLPRTPEWSVSLSLQQAVPLGGRGSLVARADYSTKSEVFNDVANTPGIAQQGYGLLNARLHYALPSGRWEVALFGTNLTGEEYLETGLFTGAFGVSIGIAGRPREWGLTAGFRF